MTDDAFRSGVLAEGIDDIILSHVVSLISESLLTATVAMRKHVLDDLVAACRVSLVIVDAFGAPGVATIRVVQEQWATVTDDVLGYFARMDQRRAFLVASERKRVVAFVNDGNGLLGGVNP